MKLTMAKTSWAEGWALMARKIMARATKTQAAQSSPPAKA